MFWEVAEQSVWGRLTGSGWVFWWAHRHSARADVPRSRVQPVERWDRAGAGSVGLS